jgi:hypothetical protein
MAVHVVVESGGWMHGTLIFSTPFMIPSIFARMVGGIVLGRTRPARYDIVIELVCHRRNNNRVFFVAEFMLL